MRTVTRMLLVVAMFMLLPVMMSGALYGLPGADCVAHSCCGLHHCCAHETQTMHEQGRCAEHDHRHHQHERMQLMREDARRAEAPAPAAVVESTCHATHELPHWVVPGASSETGNLPPLYGGYLRPRRC